MSINKLLVKLIKQAQADPDAVPDADAIPATAPQAPAAPNGASQIKKMQQTLIDLARLASAPAVQPQPQQQQQQQQQTDNNPFNDLMSSHLPTANAPAANNQPAPSGPDRMKGIISAMNSIGHSDQKTGQNIPDGQWGPRTNAGLRSVADLAAAMIKLAGDFQIKMTAYDQPSLDEFKSFIPPDEKVTPVMKVNAETIQLIDQHIMPHLQGIEKAYGEIKNSTLTKFNDASTNISLKVGNKPITVNDLLSVDALKAWQTKSGLEQMSLQNIIIVLKRQLPQGPGMPAAPMLPVEMRDT